MNFFEKKETEFKFLEWRIWHTLPVRLLSCALFCSLSLLIIIFIDRIFLAMWGIVEVDINDPESLMVSPLFVILFSISVGVSLRISVTGTKVPKRIQLGFVLVFCLICMNLFYLTMDKTEFKNGIEIYDVPIIMKQSADLSAENLGIASIPFVGLPIYLVLEIQSRAEKSAEEKGKEPNSIDSYDYMNAVKLPWK